MQLEQTIINTSLKVPEQNTCPHCRTPLEDKTNTAMLQVLFVQVANMKEQHEAEINELKKILKDGEMMLAQLKAQKAN